jgi:hypothetical protein
LKNSLSAYRFSAAEMTNQAIKERAEPTTVATKIGAKCRNRRSILLRFNVFMRMTSNWPCALNHEARHQEASRLERACRSSDQNLVINGQNL